MASLIEKGLKSHRPTLQFSPVQHSKKVSKKESPTLGKESDNHASGKARARNRNKRGVNPETRGLLRTGGKPRWGGRRKNSKSAWTQKLEAPKKKPDDVRERRCGLLRRGTRKHPLPVPRKRGSATKAAEGGGWGEKTESGNTPLKGVIF